jgi:hypothetical protein
MVNKALVLENRRGILECKRKQEHQSQHNSNSMSHIGSSSAGPIFYIMQQSVQPIPQPTREGFVSPQRQLISRPNDYQTPNTRNYRMQWAPATQDTTPLKAGKTCFNYGRKGHFALQCLDQRQQSTATRGMPPPPNRNGNSTVIKARQNYAQGRVNQLVMAESHDTPMNGTILTKLEYCSNHSFTSFLFCSVNIGQDSF